MAMTKRYTTVNGQIIFAENVGTPGKSIALVPDTLGNVIANKDVNGDMVRTCEYWPYGEIRTETDSNPTPFGYGGTWGYYSDPSGMLYVRARYYRPIEGRWLTVDPLWPGESAYGYVGNNCINLRDPSGKLKVVGCDPRFEALMRKLCARIKEATEAQRAAIAKCVLQTSGASNQTCQPFNGDRLKCMKAFCENGYVECQKSNPNDWFGMCPSFVAQSDSRTEPSGGVLIKLPPRSSNFSDVKGGPNEGRDGRMTFLHEIAHACGVAHGKYGNRSDCQCNDIYACCIFEVMMGRDGRNCTQSMQEFLQNGGRC